MSSCKKKTKRHRKEIVSVNELDMSVLKPWMTDHLNVINPSCFPVLSTERETRKVAYYVEGGSVVIRSWAVQHLRKNQFYGSGIMSEKTVYASYDSSILSDKIDYPLALMHELDHTNKLHKNEKQNSFEIY